MTLKMPDGSVRTSQAPPVTLDPKFFLALKKHVKRPDQARKIMEYIMETFNEVNGEYTDQAVCVSMCMHSRYACYLICAPSVCSPIHLLLETVFCVMQTGYSKVRLQGWFRDSEADDADQKVCFAAARLALCCDLIMS